jgi:hypothetical protein
MLVAHLYEVHCDAKRIEQSEPYSQRFNLRAIR